MTDIAWLLFLGWLFYALAHGFKITAGKQARKRMKGTYLALERERAIRRRAGKPSPEKRIGF